MNDGLTSNITLDLKNGQHTLEVFASDFTLKVVPDLKSMKRAMAIERKNGTDHGEDATEER